MLSKKNFEFQSFKIVVLSKIYRLRNLREFQTELESADLLLNAVNRYKLDGSLYQLTQKNAIFCFFMVLCYVVSTLDHTKSWTRL